LKAKTLMAKAKPNPMPAICCSLAILTVRKRTVIKRGKSGALLGGSPTGVILGLQKRPDGCPEEGFFAYPIGLPC
jgi:hypothetical protein